MKFGVVYKATNKVNDKVYIGQTLYPLNIRISQHKHEANRKYKNSHFYKAIRKYGIESFEWSILGEYAIDKLNKAEIKMIERFDSFYNGYNLTIGGDGVKGLEGKNHPFYGRSLPVKTINKIKETFKKNKTVVGKNNPMYGKKHTKKTKIKMSKAKKSYWLIIFPDGKKQVVDHLMNFCDANNLCWTHMYDVASGKVKHHKKYKCKRLYELIIRRI